MTGEQQYWENVQEALSRIFDQCEEIDSQSGYDMLEDIQFVRGFINRHKPQTEKCNGSIKAEPCEDAVSRSQALKELEESAKHHANDSREEVLLRRDRDIIRALPPVKPTQRWIPVSERLPLPEPYKGENENEECENCHYNDGEPHAECVVCDKAAGKDAKERVIAEIDKQEEWLAEAGYNAYNVDIAFGSIIRALRKMC